MNKLISIVIPVYNCEKTIEKCINSVLMQTYKNFELILVNDGSNDNSKEICQKFCLKYNNIYFIDQKNNGVSKARNRGIEKSKGKFILFLDSDDYIDKNVLELMVKNYKKNSLIKLNYCIVNNNKKMYKKFDSYDSNIFMEKIITGEIDAYIWGTLFEKKILNKIRFNEELCYLEDLLFQLEYIQFVKKVYYIGNVDSCYNYVINNSSITSNNKNFIKKIDSVYNSLYIVNKNSNYKYIKSISKRFEHILLVELSKINKIKTFQEMLNYINDNQYISLIENIILKFVLKFKLYSLLYMYLKIRNVIKKIIKVIQFKNILIVLKNLKKELSHYIFNFLYIFYKKNNFSILNDKTIVDEIIFSSKSLCRFGDGELKWALGIKQNSFQNSNKELSTRLKNILKDNDNRNLLIGIPEGINSLNNYTNDAKFYWKNFCVKYGKRVKKIIPNHDFANTNITRPYMDYKDKSYNTIKERFDNIKRIWENKDLIIVEGEFTRLGVGNDLFDNANSIKRIICPSKNAFDVIGKIEETISKIDNSYLFLVSLGPTATVIVSDMSKKGFQLVDIGHIDIEYSWFKKGILHKEKIEGKFVNEAGGMDEIDIIDEKYEKQIIEKIL